MWHPFPVFLFYLNMTDEFEDGLQLVNPLTLTLASGMVTDERYDQANACACVHTSECHAACSLFLATLSLSLLVGVACPEVVFFFSVFYI